jgi:hypothetical protein
LRKKRSESIIRRRSCFFESFWGTSVSVSDASISVDWKIRVLVAARGAKAAGANALAVVARAKTTAAVNFMVLGCFLECYYVDRKLQ